MIGSEYTSAAVQAILGPYHASTIPDSLYGAWLDTGEAVLGTFGPFTHAAFGPATDGVTNVASIDGGLAGDTWAIEYVAITNADGDIIITAATGTLTPTEGDPLVIAPGELTFTIAV